IIKGNCNKSFILNEWVNVLKSQQFARSVNLEQFGFNLGSHLPNFVLKLEIEYHVEKPGISAKDIFHIWRLCAVHDRGVYPRFFKASGTQLCGEGKAGQDRVAEGKRKRD